MEASTGIEPVYTDLQESGYVCFCSEIFLDLPAKNGGQNVNV